MSLECFVWLHTVCPAQVSCALCACVLCSVYVGWWLRALCGPSQGSVLWGPQGGAASTQRGHRWGQSHVGDGASYGTVYEADIGAFGGTQGGYKACGRLGNPVIAMGYPGKQFDTQRVRTLGRGPGAHSGDWWALGWEGGGGCGPPL